MFNLESSLLKAVAGVITEEIKTPRLAVAKYLEEYANNNYLSHNHQFLPSVGEIHTVEAHGKNHKVRTETGAAVVIHNALMAEGYKQHSNNKYGGPDGSEEIENRYLHPDKGNAKVIIYNKPRIKKSTLHFTHD